MTAEWSWSHGDPDGTVERSPEQEAWLAGLDMGRLDAQLASRAVRAKVGLTIRAVNRDAAEAIAGRHAYDLRVDRLEDTAFLWAELSPRPAR